MPAFRLFLMVVAVMSGLLPAFGQAANQIVSRWYEMLQAADEDGLAKLLADKAVIKLDDIGITQNKTEFLGTMGEWRLAIDGGNIRYKVEKTAGDTTTALACYHFPDNDMLVRETFRIEDGLIVESVQTRIAEDFAAAIEASPPLQPLLPRRGWGAAPEARADRGPVAGARRSMQSSRARPSWE